MIRSKCPKNSEMRDHVETNLGKHSWLLWTARLGYFTEKEIDYLKSKQCLLIAFQHAT